VDRKAGVTALARHGMARVQADTHLDLDAVRPRMRTHRRLGLDRGEQRAARVGERDEEGIPLRTELVAAVRSEHRPQKPIVIGEHVPVALTEQLQQSRRSFDVREHEGDRTTLQVPHVALASHRGGRLANRSYASLTRRREHD
jgi:hypothetical protein